MSTAQTIEAEFTATAEGAAAADQAAHAAPPAPERCVIVVSETLAPGQAANAAAILALSLGAQIPTLPGASVRDADGVAHPGLYPAGLPILRAAPDALAQLLPRALVAEGVEVIAFPAVAQTTTDYDAFRASVAQAGTAALEPIAVLLSGAIKPIRKLTGSFGLLR